MSRTDDYMANAADRVMIADLLARYVWAADYGTPEEWADLFTPDGVFAGADGGLACTGEVSCSPLPVRIKLYMLILPFSKRQGLVKETSGAKLL